MKLQPESKQQLVRIALGTAACTAAMLVLFAILHLMGVASFDGKVILSGLVGAGVAIANFAGICFTMEKAIEDGDEKHRKAVIKASYNGRMLLQALWVVIAIAAPCFQPFAGILPLLFPRLTIYYLQLTGKYQPQKLQNTSRGEDADNAEDPSPAGDAPEDDEGE